MKGLVIGVGAAGNKGVMELVNSNVIGMEDAIFINSTSKDIPEDIPENRRIILSPNDAGCGKERSIAKNYVLSAIQSGKLDIEKDAEDKDVVIIVSSMEGGTGSGSAPMLGKFCNQVLGKNVHIFGFAGFEDDVRGIQNTIEFFQELDDEFMVHTIRNSSFLVEAKNNHYRAEVMANKELVKRIELILGNNLINSSQNIDATDIYKVVNTAGYMTEEKIEINADMNVDDFNRICRQMISKSRSIKSKEPGQIRLGVILNLSEANEDAIDHSFSVIKQAYGDPFECFVQKQFDGQQEYIAFISSGMKLPLEEVKEIHKRYMERSEKVDKKTDNFFAEVSSLRGNAEDAKFNIGIGGKSSSVSKSDFMKQFETKPKVAPKGEK